MILQKDDNSCFKVTVIADDFTGANDTGVQLKENGLATITLLNENYLNEFYGYDAVVIDSETRNLTETQSYRRVSEIAKAVRGFINERTIIYKKIDSTLRGNVCSELKALIDVLNPGIIVVAPAYPQNNRTVVNGIHLYNDIPLDKTEFAKDPKHPINTADIRKLLKDVNLNFRHVDLDIIRSNKITNVLKTSKRKFFSFDTEEEKDFQVIIKEIIELNKKMKELILWVGSAGLAGALIEVLSPVLTNKEPVLAVAGSINSVSAVQVKKALESEKIKGFKLNVEKVLLEPAQEELKLFEEIIFELKAGFDVVLATAQDRDQVIQASSLARKIGMPLTEISNLIAEFIGNLTLKVLKHQQLSGIFLTGGDTAINVINKLNAKGAIIIREVESGIPYICLLGGPFDGLRIITKAGAFGNENSILKAISFLKNNSSFTKGELI